MTSKTTGKVASLFTSIEFHHGYAFQIIGDACYADVCLSLVNSQYQVKPICYEMQQLLTRKSI